MDEVLWKKNGPRLKHLLDTLVIVLNFQGDGPKNWLKRVIFSSKQTHLQSFDSPWKKNGPHWRRPHDTWVTVLNFEDNCPKNTLKTFIFGP